jgi:hypothetical protein
VYAFCAVAVAAPGCRGSEPDLSRDVEQVVPDQGMRLIQVDML